MRRWFGCGFRYLSCDVLVSHDYHASVLRSDCISEGFLQGLSSYGHSWAAFTGWSFAASRFISGRSCRVLDIGEHLDC